MALISNKPRIPTKPNNLSSAIERERLLRQYAGIFRNNITEYANSLAKINKPRKNFSK